MAIDRRSFLTWSAGGAFLLAMPRGDALAASDATLSPWIAIHPDGRVELTSTALEMGQGARTGQAQILADELDVAWDRVTTVMAPETAPYLVDNALFSGGSQTVKTRYDQLRKAGAAARAQLTLAAAKRWGVEAAACRAELGEVIHAPTGRRLSYGALAAEAAAVPVPADPPLKPASARRYIGKSVPTLGLADKVTGQAKYGIDFRLPGMLFASLRICPTFGGTLASVDPAPALAVAGVVKVIPLKDAVVVAARSTWAAFQGVRALEPLWKEPELRRSTPRIVEALAKAQDAPDAVVRPDPAGKDIRARLRAAFAASPRQVERTYETPYIAHAQMEPLNATALRKGDAVEIWAPCQSPTWLRDDVVAMTGLAKDRIVVHPLLMGGGFGRRLKGDYAGYAALAAKELDGPVQLLWPREEDFAHDWYRPQMRVTFRGALEPDGGLKGYETVVATSDDITGGGRPAPYDVADYVTTLSNVPCGVPIGSWRAVDSGMMLFAKESFLDECAHAAGADPLAWRERHLSGRDRALRVLRAAADGVGWRTPPREGHGRGLALLHEWDCVCAHAVEVKVEGDALTVVKIVVAADVGTAVNPGQVRAQFEGGVLMGLSAALTERVTVTDGRADQLNFGDYQVIRMNQVPPIEVLLFESPEAPVGGVGEPPVPGVAPALANAVFAATGRRVRALPFASQGFTV